jgi:hypothetical protein
VELPEIAVIQEAAHRVRGDVPCAVLVELVPGRKFKTAISTSLETSMEKAGGLDHDHTGSAAITMAVGQPEERHGLSPSFGVIAVSPSAC